MTKPTTISVLSILLALFLVSCSGGGPTIPQLSSNEESAIKHQTDVDAHRQNTHSLLGYYLIYLNPADLESEVVPVRSVAGHWNALKWLEQAPCTDCLKLVNIDPSGSGSLLVDVQFEHPFSGLMNLTGFDVRGIAMFNGSHVFPDSGLNTPDSGAGEGELVNADGYTTLYNSSTAGSGPGGLQGYIKGKLASIIPPNATLNGYKRHITDDPANTRNAFYAGDVTTVTYEVVMPTAGFIFGYAVDASWVAPTVKPVEDPMTDFPPEANCPEPWNITVQEEPYPTSPGLSDEGGSTILSVDVYDYQGKDSHALPVIECPELFDGNITATFSADGAGFTTYEAVVTNDKYAPAGQYKCLISVEDNENAGSPDWLDLTAYQIINLSVAKSHLWTRTWGGTASEGGNDVVTDSAGNCYVTGWYWGTVDFDPGAGIDEHISIGMSDAYLCKYDSDGNFLWAKTWGATQLDIGHAIAMDSLENIYVTGWFLETFDFDPGDGTDEHTSNGAYDAFLSKFDSNGDFQWARTWGGTSGETGAGVATDESDNVFVIGRIMSDTDFNPGPGSDDHSLIGESDAYLSKFDSAGNFLWAKTWGGTLSDGSDGVTTDVSGDVSVIGYFEGTFDFDPGAGTDEHTSNGEFDTFLSTFDSDGAFQWTRTWGGMLTEAGFGLSADSSGNKYASGWYMDTVDFDPGIDVDEHTSNGDKDIYLSSFDPDGNFLWARAWGGTMSDICNDVAVDEPGNLFITGSFQDIVDFDPGPGNDEHLSNGGDDGFIARFNTSGNILWARTWGGSELDIGLGLTTDASDNLFITGYFEGAVDFDPGPGLDNHTAMGSYEAFLSKFLPY